MSDFVLYEEDVKRLNTILAGFVDRAQLDCTLLTNREGLLLTCHGATEAIDTTSVAALVTGSFAATVTIANLIGESEFNTMFHRGKKRHIHITQVDDDRYLASIFGNKTRLDKVSYYARRYGARLKTYLASINDQAENAVLPEFDTDDFGGEAEGELPMFASKQANGEQPVETAPESKKTTPPQQSPTEPTSQPMPSPSTASTPASPGAGSGVSPAVLALLKRKATEEGKVQRGSRSRGSKRRTGRKRKAVTASTKART